MLEEWVYQAVSQALRRGLVGEAACVKKPAGGAGGWLPSFAWRWRDSMRYESNAAFRRALEERLRQQSLTFGGTAGSLAQDGRL